MAKAKTEAAKDGSSRMGGPPHETASAWAKGRRAGFVAGFCSALNQGIHWAEELAPGTGKQVADKLVPFLERMIPDAESVYPPLAKLRKGKTYDEPLEKPL